MPLIERTNFDGRMARGSLFEQQVKTYLLRKQWLSEVNGSEHTHKLLSRELRRDSSWRSLVLRHTPDIMGYADGNLCYFDPKDSQAIERDSYLVCCHVHCTTPVIIVMRTRNNVVRWEFVDRLKFRDSHKVVERHGEHAHPIDAEGWICPRQGHGFAGNGSGTPYRQVYTDTMRVYVDFWDVVMQESIG